MKIGSIKINNELDLIRVRKMVNSLCRLLKCTKVERVRIGTAATALAINIFEYSGQGQLEFSLVEKQGKKGLHFSIKDFERNKEDIEQDLNENKTNSKENGIGLTGVKNVMDEFLVDTLNKNGIKISAIIWLRDPENIPDSITGKLKTIFSSVSDSNAIEVLKILNKDFLGLLNKLQQKNISLAKKNHELKKLTQKMSKDIVISNDNLKREMNGRLVAENEFIKRHLALDAIFQITTKNLETIDELSGEILKQIADLSGAPMVSLSIQTTDQSFTKLIVDNKIVDGYKFKYNGPSFNSDNVVSFEENMTEVFFLDHPLFTEINYATGKAIFSSAQTIIGDVFVFFKSEKRFEDFEEKLLKIFARYLAVEIERHEMEIKLKQDTEMKTLGMVTSGVAHEVRNPLNAIVVVSEALFGKIGNNKEYQRHIRHIRDQVKRLTELMNDLLNLGRPLKEDNIHVLPISDCISRSIDTWKKTSTQFSDRKVIVHTEENTGQLLIQTDPHRFCQVIVNLLDNACYYSPENGTVKIHVSVQPDMNKVYLRIIDNGPGIEEKYLESFFEPFFSMRKDGTGLGTSIVKRLILLHGGQISVYNNKSQPGLCVEICLPIAQK